MPKSLGALLILASFTYVVFVVDIHLPADAATSLMLMMGISELALSIWLLAKRNTLPKNVNSY
jgi:Ca2+/Na+ antiporter